MDMFSELLSPHSPEQKAYGVLTGIVRDNYDSKYPGMVKVEYAMGESGKNVSGWIPVAMPYTGKDCGMCFMPEIGTEVVVAFHMGDWNRPIVIGSLWNKNMPMPREASAEKNPIKKIETKGGHSVTFEDKDGKGSVEIKTKEGLTVLLDDEKDTITLQAAKGKSKLIINEKSGKITLDADKELELKVGGKELVTLTDKKAKVKAGSISVKADQKLKLEGQSTGLKGTSLKIEADGSLSAESSGVTQIKGSMLKLN